jgi:hypothetical protein
MSNVWMCKEMTGRKINNGAYMSNVWMCKEIKVLL